MFTLTTVAIVFPVLGLLGYAFLHTSKTISNLDKQIEAQPDKEFFLVGFYSQELHRTRDEKKIPGSEYILIASLEMNGLNERRVSYKTNKVAHTNAEKSAAAVWFEATEVYNSYMKPWLDKTIDTEKLLELTKDSSFHPAGSPIKRSDKS